MVAEGKGVPDVQEGNRGELAPTAGETDHSREAIVIEVCLAAGVI